KQIRNKDLRTELEYFSEDYDEDREMEPRPVCIKETTPVLLTRSSRARRQREMAIDFKDVPNCNSLKEERKWSAVAIVSDLRTQRPSAFE
ncbi:hypothetical protein Tco_0433828, partial [Tanacetum coccineum]